MFFFCSTSERYLPVLQEFGLFMSRPYSKKAARVLCSDRVYNVYNVARWVFSLSNKKAVLKSLGIKLSLALSVRLVSAAEMCCIPSLTDLVSHVGPPAFQTTSLTTD